MNLRLVFVVSALILCTRLGVAQPRESGPPGVYTSAIVVGSNRGGVGQAPLHFAEHDAERMAELLNSLGRVPRDATHLLVGPSRADLEAVLQQVREDLRRVAERGQPAQLIFFYSGHARADSLNLGMDRYPLQDLRTQLLALPADLRMVFLDACQSGAFSGIKGAEPAADFSFSATRELQTTGVAVISSSSARELSQESPELQAGYFSHHLLVAMRGAADRDRDGRVSLQETYDYAYQHTLADTARTRVGQQHVSLEQTLSGQGDVALSYPAFAAAQLQLDAPLAGDFLVQLAQGGAVIAELHKRTGEPLTIGVPPGDYAVVMRNDDGVFDCRFSLERGEGATLNAHACEPVPEASGAQKGSSGPRYETWYVELGASLLRTSGDAYTDRLEDFSFSQGLLVFPTAALRLGLGRGLHPHLTLGLLYAGLERERYHRESTAGDTRYRDTFSWSGHALLGVVRGRASVWDQAIQAYVQLALGVGLVVSKFVDQRGAQGLERTTESHLGPAGEVAVGVSGHVFGVVGVYFELARRYAPILANETGDIRRGDTTSITLGLRGRLFNN